MKKKILVVEDETSLLHVLKDQLQDEGFEVQTATTGEQGLACALLWHPDLILIDIVMPQMNGIDMLTLLRDDQWGSLVSVIMLTNVSEPDTIDQLIELGVHAYVVKADWKLEDVVRMVKEEVAVYSH